MGRGLWLYVHERAEYYSRLEVPGTHWVRNNKLGRKEYSSLKHEEKALTLEGVMVL